MDISAQGDAAGEKRQATLRRHAASLTETTGRAPLNHRHDGRAGEGAR
ncbi:DUF6380 family protein [Streptomyces coerulescens]|uniref:DUF6380 family protein n=1 Tax=Streptomyces coerulescens TaxID=29304 RepID=A0ABW0CAU4_STRCD